MKRLYLADYQIEYRGLSLALLGAVIAAKVVLILEHVPMGRWVRSQPALLEVALRTLLYSVGVFVVIVLERGFEARHEHGGFGSGIAWVVQHRDIHRVWADTLGVGCALFGFNALTVIQQYLGELRVRDLFLRPMEQNQKNHAQVQGQKTEQT
jgi:hypothetical protein